MRKLNIYLVFALLVSLVVIPNERVFARPARLPSLQSSANDLIAEVNALRVANGLPPYTVSPILMGTAQAQANFARLPGIQF